MKVSHLMYLPFCVSLNLIGIAVFLKGFFPIKHTVPGYAVANQNTCISSKVLPDLCIAKLDPIFGRMVFVLIDALRADFVLPTSQSDLPQMTFVRTLIDKNETHSFLGRAHAPTVTMPRIKAITTGGIPGFVDVVLNFDSKSLSDDNLITQLHRAGKKMVFYGDDTWLKLFPEHFTRTDGTTSFFVTDYTEVDNNVTRHIDHELATDDWEVLILHYLGLDHIGHLAGPKSPLVKPKLEEMDSIIKKIYNKVTEQDKLRDKPTLIVLCGDHGMSEQGSHGGSSNSETATPLVLMSSLFKNGQGLPFGDEEIQQIDMAPTLSLLLGSPIPQNSLGVFQTAQFSVIPNTARLRGAFLNAHQLLQVLKGSDEEYEASEGFQHFHRATNSHRDWLDLNMNNSSIDSMAYADKIVRQYFKAATTIRNKLSSSLSSYDLYAMGVGMALLWISLLMLLIGHNTTSNDNRIMIEIINGTQMVFLVSFTVLLLMVHTVVCTSIERSDFLCETSTSAGIILASVLLGAITVYVLVVQIVSNKPPMCESWTSILSSMKKTPVLNSALIIGTIVHTFTLLASSFVEEEHQTWYYFTLSVIFLMGITSLAKGPHKQRKDASRLFPTPVVESSPAVYYNQRTLRGEMETEVNSVCVNKAKSNPNPIGNMIKHKQKTFQYDWMTKTPKTSLFDLMIIIYTLCIGMCHRLCRAWNRTGDKWAHLPDIGDWLVKPDNKVYLSALTAVSIGLIISVQFSRSNSSLFKWLFIVGSMSVYRFRAANGAVMLPGVYSEGTPHKGVTEARAVYFMILCLILQTLYSAKSCSKNNENERNDDQKKHPSPSDHLTAGNLYGNIHMIWTLLMMLLVRPHNLCLVALLVIQHHLLTTKLKSQLPKNSTALTLLFIWMGQASFYFLGNSNSIATVDVSAGYIGLDSYNPVLIGILMCLATYCGLIFWILALFEEINCCVSRLFKLKTARLSFAYSLMLSRALPVALYMVLVTFQRHHLFVWSVFSPKLLYEGMHTLVYCSLSIVTLLFV